MELVSAGFGMFAFCLLFLDLPLVFSQLKVLGWAVQLPAEPPLSPSRASQGGFYCDWEGGTPVSLLGTVQSSGKVVGVFPLPWHHSSWPVPAYFQ